MFTSNFINFPSNFIRFSWNLWLLQIPADFPHILCLIQISSYFLQIYVNMKFHQIFFKLIRISFPEFIKFYLYFYLFQVLSGFFFRFSSDLSSLYISSDFLDIYVFTSIFIRVSLDLCLLQSSSYFLKRFHQILFTFMLTSNILIFSSNFIGFFLDLR